ncbi:MAG: hypothetical protein FWF09_04470, partial [Bacteroidales bacterium]|nr:hypothetical protein [Bacteroidales bacterium]
SVEKITPNKSASRRDASLTGCKICIMSVFLPSDNPYGIFRAFVREVNSPPLEGLGVVFRAFSPFALSRFRAAAWDG